MLTIYKTQILCLKMGKEEKFFYCLQNNGFYYTNCINRTINVGIKKKKHIYIVFDVQKLTYVTLKAWLTYIH
jgi:hypothetical protein